MRNPEQLEWEQALRVDAGRRRGVAYRVIIALVVATACAIGAFVVGTNFWDDDREAEKRGAYIGSKARRQTGGALVYLVMAPAVVGTVAFFGSFLLIGGRVPSQYKDAFERWRRE